MLIAVPPPLVRGAAAAGTCLLLLALACAAPYASAGVIAGTGAQPTSLTLGQSTATRLVHAPGGEGHALLLPYFNVHDGNATLLSVVNADLVNGKAIRLRFRGSANGDTLLVLTVLLGAGDVWNATLTEGSGGIAQIVTADGSCTLPRMAGTAQPLLTGRLSATWTAAEKARHTREGYVEILTMADLQSKTATVGVNGVVTPSGPGPLYATIAQSSGTPPACNEAVIQGALQDDHIGEASAAAHGFATPTGGLMGRWSILNVPQTTTYSGAMHALRAVDDSGANARANFVLFPQTDAFHPDGARHLTADPVLRDLAYTSKTATGVGTNSVSTAAVTPRYHDLPDLSTPYVVAPGADASLRQAERLTAALAVLALKNEYAVETAIDARTDWVLSLPARRYSVAVDYAAAGALRKRFSLVPPAGNQYFHDDNAIGGTTDNGLICSYARPVFTNREGLSRSYDAVFTGSFQFFFCGAASVFRWARRDFDNGIRAADQPAGPLGNTVNRLMGPPDVPASSGWGWLGFTGYAATGMGLPVMGSAFLKATNPAVAPGMSGTYGLNYDHSLTR